MGNSSMCCDIYLFIVAAPFRLFSILMTFKASCCLCSQPITANHELNGAGLLYSKNKRLGNCDAKGSSACLKLPVDVFYSLKRGSWALLLIINNAFYL